MICNPPNEQSGTQQTPQVAGSGSLLDEVRGALHTSGYSWLQRLIVTTVEGTIVLRGRVPTYYLKQLAQVTVMAVPGVIDLRNELTVEGS